MDIQIEENMKKDNNTHMPEEIMSNMKQDANDFLNRSSSFEQLREMDEKNKNWWR